MASKHEVQEEAIKDLDFPTIADLADAISEVSQGIRKLRSGRLNNKALVILIQNSCPGKPREM